MKCRLLVPQEVVKGQTKVVDFEGNERLILDVVTEQPGFIIEDKEAWRLCGIHPTIILPLGGIVSDLRTLDGFVAEPADEECLRAAIAKGYVKPDFKLTPVAPATADLPADAA